MLLPKQCPFNVNLKTSGPNPLVNMFDSSFLTCCICGISSQCQVLKLVWVAKHPVRRKLSDILWQVFFGKGIREEQVSVLDPRFPSLYIFTTRNQTHALSLHTQGEVCRLENSATSSTTPQGSPAWIAFPQLFYNVFLAACANVSF